MATFAHVDSYVRWDARHPGASTLPSYTSIVVEIPAVPSLLCVAAHPLTPGFRVGDECDLVVVNGQMCLELTAHMLRQIAQAVEDGALVMIGGTGGGISEEAIAEIEANWERLKARIDGLESAVQVRKRLRDVAEGSAA
jgi:hypothetical protein